VFDFFEQFESDIAAYRNW